MPYKAFNAAMPTTVPMAAVATGTATKTMLQLAPPSGCRMQVISWGYTLSALPGAVGTIELIQTDVAATVTAHTPTGIMTLDAGSASRLTLGASATGFTATVEGATTATTVFDTDQIPITAGLVQVNYDYQFMPDERPIVPATKFLRVRATTPTSGVNMLCWVAWNEI